MVILFNFDTSITGEQMWHELFSANNWRIFLINFEVFFNSTLHPFKFSPTFKYLKVNMSNDEMYVQRIHFYEI